MQWRGFVFSKINLLHRNTMMGHLRQCLSMNSLLFYHNKVWLITFISCLYEICLCTDNRNHFKDTLTSPNSLPELLQTKLIYNLVRTQVFWDKYVSVKWFWGQLETDYEAWVLCSTDKWGIRHVWQLITFFREIKYNDL